jgi:arylsulfatase A-like enzyme
MHRNPNRRGFLKSMGLGAAAAAMPRGLLAENEGAMARKPNILFILADDLGYGDLGCYGQKQIRTPRLDRMAAEGLRFTQHYAGTTVCAPSRCALMTGLHTGHCYIRGNSEVEPEGQRPLPAGTPTVARLLQRAGYRTGLIGKWGLGGPGGEGVPTRQGFDYFFGYLCQRQAHFYYPPHLWRNEEKVVLEGNDFEKQTGKYSPDLLAEEALAFVRKNKEHPFFLYLALTIPHAELAVPDDSLAQYKGKFDEKPFARKHYGPQETPNAALAAMITRMDRDIGRLLDLLKELGLDDNTLVLFSSDNGPHKEGGRDPKYFQSSGPLRGIKRDLYEGGIRVPLLARWPGKVPAGAASDHVSAFWDFLPTCADLAGAEAPRSTDGISFLPTLLGRPADQKGHEYLYWEFHEGGFHQALRMGDWKAVRHGAKGEIELYNLKDDMREEQNVADAHPDIVKKADGYFNSARTESKLWPKIKPKKAKAAES